MFVPTDEKSFRFKINIMFSTKFNISQMYYYNMVNF